MNERQEDPLIRQAAVAAVLAPLALAGSAEARTLPQKYTDVRQATKKVCGDCVGRDIRKQGMRLRATRPDGSKGWTHRPPTIREWHRTIAQMERLKRPVPSYLRRVAVPPAQPPAGVKTAGEVSRGGSSNPMVNPACESGGDPQATGNPGYWGKYQFDADTWTRHGGSPSTYGSASEAEQDRVAARVKYDAWPNC